MQNNFCFPIFLYSTTTTADSTTSTTRSSRYGVIYWFCCSALTSCEITKFCITSCGGKGIFPLVQWNVCLFILYFLRRDRNDYWLRPTKSVVSRKMTRGCNILLLSLLHLNRSFGCYDWKFHYIQMKSSAFASHLEVNEWLNERVSNYLPPGEKANNLITKIYPTNLFLCHLCRYNTVERGGWKQSELRKRGIGNWMNELKIAVCGVSLLFGWDCRINFRNLEICFRCINKVIVVVGVDDDLNF